MMLRNSLKLSRNMSNIIPAQKRPAALSTQFISEFKDFYPKLIDSSISQISFLENAHLKERLKKLSEYYTLAKEPIQGELLLYAWELLENPSNVNDSMQHQLFTIASAVETIQAYFIILDDVMDEGKTRCGKTCWHLLPDAKSLFINDASLLRNFINAYIKLNVDNKKCGKVLDIIDEFYFIVDSGQYLDMALPCTKQYNREMYHKITHYKASFFAINSNIHLALALANKLSEESQRQVDELCFDLGVMIQVHNDFSDYMDVDETLTKKSSTDIQNGKCTWLAVTALENCSPAQRKVFEECYGSWDPEDVKRIRELYAELDMPRLYRQEEQSRYDTYLRKARSLPADATPSCDFFINILDFIRSYADDTSRYYYK